MRRKIFILLAIVWMAVIFYFSARAGEDSSEDSSRVAALILRVVNPDYRTLPPEEQRKMLETISHPVRKAAHASEYAVLAGLLLGALLPAPLIRDSGDEKKSAVTYALTAWAGTVLYAVTDEIHQYFVPDRACSFTDVCIDGAGALCGVLLAMIFVRYHMNRYGAS